MKQRIKNDDCDQEREEKPAPTPPLKPEDWSDWVDLGWPG